MKYICECCREEKEDWLAIAYKSPYPYVDLSEELEKHSSHDDRFVKDCYNGISKKEAVRRINVVLRK